MLGIPLLANFLKTPVHGTNACAAVGGTTPEDAATSGTGGGRGEAATWTEEWRGARTVGRIKRAMEKKEAVD